MLCKNVNIFEWMLLQDTVSQSTKWFTQTPMLISAQKDAQLLRTLYAYDSKAHKECEHLEQTSMHAHTSLGTPKMSTVPISRPSGV